MVIGLGTSMLHIREERGDDIWPEIITVNGDFALIVKASDLIFLYTIIIYVFISR
jgi:hypothetical protein